MSEGKTCTVCGGVVWTAEQTRLYIESCAQDTILPGAPGAGEHGCHCRRPDAAPPRRLSDEVLASLDAGVTAGRWRSVAWEDDYCDPDAPLVASEGGDRVVGLTTLDGMACIACTEPDARMMSAAPDLLHDLRVERETSAALQSTEAHVRRALKAWLPPGEEETGSVIVAALGAAEAASSAKYQLAMANAALARLERELLEAQQAHSVKHDLLLALADACDDARGSSQGDQIDLVIGPLEKALELPDDSDFKQVATAIRRVCGVSRG